MSNVDDADGPHLGGAAQRGRPGLPVDPHRLRRALWADKRWLIGAGIVGLLIGFLWVKLMMQSHYETSALLKYDGDQEVSDLFGSREALGPAADALMRQSVLRKIRDEADFRGSLTALAAQINYRVDYMVRTMRISVPGETGEDAAEFARIVTDVFVTYHKERQSRRIEEEITRTGKRIEAAEHQAEEARRIYDTFRDQHGIADLSTEQGSMVSSAATLRANSELMTPEIRAYEAQVRSLEAQLASTPKTSFVPGGSSPEQATYNRLREELASARATLSPNHPRVQALEQQVNHLRSQLQSGGGARSSVGGLVGANATYQVVEGQLRGAKSSLAALRERQKGLSAMADKAHQRVEAFSDIEGEASALLADVHLNEGLLGKLRSSEALLEDALRDPPSGFVVLDPGAVPEYPVRNKKKIVVFGAVPMIAVGLVLLVVLRREFHGLLLETPAEVAFWGNGPVLGATSWPNDLHSLDELVAGLDDFVPRATGSVLIVGGSPEESRLASELADRMNSDWFPTHEQAAAPSTPESVPAHHAPLQTPAPSGPYPIGGSGAQSVALARRPSTPPASAIRLARPGGQLQLGAWDGPYESQALRRAARIADRVLVLVRACAMSAPGLNGIQNRVGRKQGIGYIVVGLPDELHSLPDRVGDVAGFWRS